MWWHNTLLLPVQSWLTVNLVFGQPEVQVMHTGCFLTYGQYNGSLQGVVKSISVRRLSGVHCPYHDRDCGKRRCCWYVVLLCFSTFWALQIKFHPRSPEVVANASAFISVLAKHNQNQVRGCRTQAVRWRLPKARCNRFKHWLLVCAIKLMKWHLCRLTCPLCSNQ